MLHRIWAFSPSSMKDLSAIQIAWIFHSLMSLRNYFKTAFHPKRDASVLMHTCGCECIKRKFLVALMDLMFTIHQVRSFNASCNKHIVYHNYRHFAAEHVLCLFWRTFCLLLTYIFRLFRLLVCPFRRIVCLFRRIFRLFDVYFVFFDV